MQNIERVILYGPPVIMYYDKMSLRVHCIKCIENNENQLFFSKPKRRNLRNASKLVNSYFVYV